MIPFAKREPQPGGAADERQMEPGAETNILQGKYADSDGGYAERETRAHPGCIHVEIGRIHEAVQWDELADFIHKRQRALENDFIEFNRYIDLFVRTRLEAYVVELRADQRIGARGQDDCEFLQRTLDVEPR